MKRNLHNSHVMQYFYAHRKRIAYFTELNRIYMSYSI